MYQLEDGFTFTSDDKPTECDLLCCNQGVLRIFKIYSDVGLCHIEELLGGKEWKQVVGSEIKIQRVGGTEKDKFHYPIGGFK